ncbi:Potassium-transporting ATPase C chain [Salmonella enterica subsp. enterica serovar Senftenberg str. A4-543]|uniref:Potassium-transporting ATPase C chain n=1 Tax=Salmonella enterica subsp. enterica serovar Senftenberg str. A4-543 TaxID=913082 RepID=G5QWN9_SALSE|nr:Potassium-transporting ATPase C chain [Salmonella enterica subsp. enterica serovar Senftenberg str. A4-543]
MMIGLRPAFSTMLFLLLLTGGVYPLLTTALGQWWFPWQANGSLIHKDNVIRGSALIGQSFTAAGYFHGRPSATADTPYNPLASGGSNLAASNPELDAQIQSRVAALRADYLKYDNIARYAPLTPRRVPRFRLSWRRPRQAGWIII